MVLDPAAAVFIHTVEEGIDLALGRVVAQGRNRLSELVLVDGAVPIVVPLAEQIDQLGAVLVQHFLELLLHARARASRELHRSRQRSDARRDVVRVHILCGELCISARVTLRRSSFEVALRQISARTLAQHHVELRVFERARAVLVQRIKDCVRVFFLDLEAKGVHRLVELLLVNGAALIIIPRTEQVHDAARRAHQRVLERPLQVLVHVDEAATIYIEGVKADLKLFIWDLAHLAIAHERTELFEVKLLVIVRIGGVAVGCIQPHACCKVNLARSGHVL